MPWVRDELAGIAAGADGDVTAVLDARTPLTTVPLPPARPATRTDLPAVPPPAARPAAGRTAVRPGRDTPPPSTPPPLR